MRLDTFHQFAIDALAKAPDVQTVAPWDRGANHLRGIHVTLSTGSQFWIGVSAAAASGDKWEGPEIPVEGEPPAEVPFPELYEGGKVTPARAQAYFAAAIANSRNKQVKEAYAYSSEAQTAGFGVIFHNEARGFCLFHHTARPGQDRGNRVFDLQAAF